MDIKLPCEVGTQVWLTEWWSRSHLQWMKQSTPLPRSIYYFEVREDGVFAYFFDGGINVKHFGEIVFFTKEEAKAHLSMTTEGE